jgi:hypothetical protein
LRLIRNPKGMIFLKTLIFFAFAMGVVITLAKRSSGWAVELQHYYMRQSVKMYGQNGNWEKPWIRQLFKALIFFFGLMLMLGAYVLLFSSGTEQQ